MEILTLHVFWKKVQGSNSINRMRDVPFYRKVSTMPHFFLTDVEKMTGLILSFLSFFDVLCVKKKLFVYRSDQVELVKNRSNINEAKGFGIHLMKT